MDDIDRKFKYLIELRKYWIISGIIDIPILILLWWLDYKVGFWILLLIILINSSLRVHEIEKRESDLKIYYD